MATFPVTTQSGPMTWAAQGRNITNHEVFAFTLEKAAFQNIGALITDVAVFINPTRYQVTISPVPEKTLPDPGVKPYQVYDVVGRTIVGRLESTGV